MPPSEVTISDSSAELADQRDAEAVLVAQPLGIDRIGHRLERPGSKPAAAVEHLDLDAVLVEVAADDDALVARQVGVGLDGVGGGFGHRQAQVVDPVVAEVGSTAAAAATT